MANVSISAVASAMKMMTAKFLPIRVHVDIVNIQIYFRENIVKRIALTTVNWLNVTISVCVEKKSRSGF